MYQNKFDKYPDSIVPFKPARNPDVRRVLFYLRDKELTLQRFIKKQKDEKSSDKLSIELRVIEDAIIWITSNLSI